MNLFLAPAAAGNIQKSITNGVRMTLLERYLSGRDLRQLKDVLGRDGPYHCFAMTENKRTTFEGMDLGDEVMLTITGPKKYDYICQVAYKIENEEFGRALWEHTPNKPWKLIYFVKDVLEINIDKAELAKQLKYKRGFRNSGVMRVRSELTTRIISTHGSIREFVMRMSKGELPQVSDQGFFEVEEAVQVAQVERFERPQYLSRVIDDVEALKNDPHHQERAHEALIEAFYIANDYEKYAEIKYRKGRIDISIELDGQTAIVNEVKRDWGLSKANEKAVEQGYRYANRSGARYVVITNGDYFAIFDRDRGERRSIDENFVGECRLSKLRKEDVRLLEMLRKEVVLEMLKRTE